MLQADRVLDGRTALDDLNVLRARGYAQEAQWQTASKELDECFEYFQRIFGLPFKTWAANVLGDDRNIETLFYPFGGADFCFPYYLFPNARDYFLVGYEPCSLWPLNELSPAFSLDGTVEALRHYLQFSYFITKDLQVSLSSDAVRGVLPLFLMQMARSGLPILSVEPIDADVDGLRIEFGNRRAPQRLHYYRQDLRDVHWLQNNHLHRRLLKSPDLAVFIKSASYLLHEPPFERLRNVIRDRASVLVQDPSGVPYDLLQNWHWSTGLHGRFHSDIPIFSRYDQSSLVRAYRAANEKTMLKFGIGYLTDPDCASLLVASPRQRKFPARTEVACAS